MVENKGKRKGNELKEKKIDHRPFFINPESLHLNVP
jgi:hypothetical protein